MTTPRGPPPGMICLSRPCPRRTRSSRSAPGLDPPPQGPLLAAVTVLRWHWNAPSCKRLSPRSVSSHCADRPNAHDAILLFAPRGNCLPWMNDHPFVFGSIHGLPVGLFLAWLRCPYRDLLTGIPTNRRYLQAPGRAPEPRPVHSDRPSTSRVRPGRPALGCR